MSIARFRAVKVKQPSSSSLLFVAKNGAQVSGQIADICQFPPVKAAAVVLLAILDTVEHVKRNKENCVRLARRAAMILLDVRDHMKGRWHNAPPSLIKNLRRMESTLLIIYEFMKNEASGNWRSRLMRKGQIEGALEDYNTLLDDAAQSFQISVMIDIQYSLHKAVQSRSNDVITRNQSDDTLIEILNSAPYTEGAMHEDVIVSSPVDEEEILPRDDDALSEYRDKVLEKGSYLEDLGDLDGFDDRGFTRYSDSDIHSYGSLPQQTGWWTETSEAVVNGETVTMKSYSGPNARKNWLSDVRMLQNFYHPNLPQLIGLSENTTPIPFLLLTNVQSRTPEAIVLDALHNKSLAFCAELILRLYRDVSEAALYTQQESKFSDSELQDFVEQASYRLDSEHSVIVGLPPPREGRWVTFRSYGLTESLLGVALKMLPNNGDPMHLHKQENQELPLPLQRKLSHLAVFARGLLPANETPPGLAPTIQALISDETYDGARHPTLPLSVIRSAVLSGGASGHHRAHAWRENQAIPAHKFRVGDLGYVAPGAMIGEGFVKLCNVVDEGLVKFDLAVESFSNKWDWKDMRGGQQDVQGFPMGPNVMGWPIAVNPDQQIDCNVEHVTSVEPRSQAWQFLLANGKALGERFHVVPDELVLITSAGTTQSFSMKNGWGHTSAFPTHGHHQMHQPRGHPRPGFGAPQPFGRTAFGHFPGQAPMPKIFYLFTSPDKGFNPYWAQQPMLLPPGAEAPPLDRDAFGRVSWLHGYIYYIMGYSEDFV